MKIKSKLLLLTIMPIVILLTIILIININYEINHQYDDTKEYLLEKNNRLAKEIEHYLEYYLDTVRTLAYSFSTFETIPLEKRRDVFKSKLLEIFNRYPDILGVFTAWEPNALDGLDARYKNRKDHDNTGRFLPYFSRYSGNLEYSVLVDYDKPGVGDWYILSVQSGEEMVIGPYTYQVGDEKKEIVSLVVPITKNNKVLGIVGIDIDLIDLEKMINRVKVFETGFARLIDSKGIIIFHHDKSRIGKMWGEDKDGKTQDLLKRLKNGEIFIERAYSISLNKMTLKPFTPIFIGKVKEPWIVSIVVQETEIFKDLIIYEIVVIILALFLLALFSSINIFFVRKIIKPIIQINRAVKDLATGEGDLTKKITVESNDEFGELSKNFNIFIDKLRTIVVELKSINEKSSKMGDNLASVTEETSSTIEEIATTVRSMDEKIVSLKEEIEKSSKSTDNILNFVKDVDLMIENQQKAISVSSTSIEEMIASINSMEDITEKKYNSTIDLKNIAEDGHKYMGETINIIDQVSQKAESILELVQIINGIASQTNLLAMNASIEAAHAGEYGKGFAVVANEIRNLAESTSNNAKNISNNLKDIVNSIKQSNNITQETGKKINLMINGIDELTLSMKEMLSGMKELTIGTRQITNSLVELKSISKDVSTSMGDVSVNINEINNNMKNILNFVSEAHNGMNEVTIGMNEIANASTELARMGGENANNLELINKNINKFKL